MASEWERCDGSVVAIYPFSGSTGQDGEQEVNPKLLLPLQCGDVISVTHQSDDWYHGTSVLSDGTRGPRGIFPKTYVVRKTGEMARKRDYDAVMFELRAALREWSVLLWSYYGEGNLTSFNDLQNKLRTLINWHRRVTDAKLPASVRDSIKNQVRAKIERGRRAMKLDLVARTLEGQVMTHLNTPVGALLNEFRSTEKFDAIENALLAPKKGSKASLIDLTFSRLQKRLTLNKTSQRSEQMVSTSSRFAVSAELSAALFEVEEPLQVSLSLYHGQKCISNSLVLRLDKNGLPENTSLMGNMKSLFVDLKPNWVERQLWLVCRVTRRGLIMLDKKKAKTEMRRPLSVSAHLLNPQVLRNEVQLTLPACRVEDGKWSTQHLSIISGAVNQRELPQIPQAKGVQVRVRLLQYEEGEDVRKSDPKLAKVPLVGPWGKDVGGSKMFLTLEGCEGFGVDKNLELDLQVLDVKFGMPKKSVLWGADQLASYKSAVLVRQSNPQWSESICINLDNCDPSQVSVYLTISHATKSKISAIAGAQLALTKPDGTIVNDRRHSLSTFKAPKKLLDAIQNPHKLAARRGETIFVRTQLASSGHTQNLSMLSLLEWKSNPNTLLEVLQRFLYVEKTETLKFLRESLDAVFAILEGESMHGIVSKAAFQCLTHIISMLLDERQTGTGVSHRSQLDHYVKTQFNSKSAHLHLTKCLLSSLVNPRKNKKTIVGSLKAMGYVFKLINKSKELSLGRKPSYRDLVDVKDNVLEFFQRLCEMLKIPDLALLSVQATALKNFNSWRLELSQVFCPKDMAYLIGQVLESVPKDNKNNKSLTGEKLNLLYELLADDPVFVDKEAQKPFFSAFSGQIAVHWNSGESSERGFAAVLMGSLLQSVQRNLKSLPPSLLSLLPLALNMYSETKDAETLTNFLAFFTLVPRQHFQALLKGSDVMAILKLLRYQLENSPYDTTWFAMRMFQFDATRIFLKQIVNQIVSGSAEMVAIFVTVAAQFLCAPQLDISRFSDAKKEQMLDAYGDLRLAMLPTLKSGLSVLKSRHPQMIPVMVPQFLALAMVQESNIRKMGVSFFFTALCDEFKVTGGFEKCRNKTVNFMIRPEVSRDAEFGVSLVDTLAALFVKKPKMAAKGKELMVFLREFHDHMLQVTTLPATPEYDFERSLAIVKILAKSSSSAEPFCARLIEQHTRANLWSEAGFVMLTLCEHYDWDSEEILSPLGMAFPEQPERQRKEAMLLQAIQQFERDHQYEQSIETLQMLRARYFEVHKYDKLKGVLERISANTLRFSEDRLLVEYFYVGFVGTAWDKSLSGLEFVFRGNVLERLDEFTARMKEMYPEAQVLTYTHEPAEKDRASAEPLLQIYRVFPSSLEEIESGGLNPANTHISAKIRKYRAYQNVNVFLYERPYKKTKTKNEIFDTWIEQTFLHVDIPLPGIVRFARVTRRSEKSLSPLGLAVKTMMNKNTDLQDILTLYRGPNRPDDSQQFISMVQGVVDAAVGGGFRMYSDSLMNDAYLDANPSDRDKVDRMKAMYKEQIRLMSAALELWPTFCPSSFAPMLDHLQKTFKEIEKDA